MHKNLNFAIDRAFRVIQIGEFGLWTGPGSDGVGIDTGQEMSNTIDWGVNESQTKGMGGR